MREREQVCSYVVPQCVGRERRRVQAVTCEQIDTSDFWRRLDHG